VSSCEHHPDFHGCTLNYFSTKCNPTKTLNIFITVAKLSIHCKLWGHHKGCMNCGNFTCRPFVNLCCLCHHETVSVENYLQCFDLFSHSIAALSNIEIASFLRWYILVELHSHAYARRYYGTYDMLENSMMKVRFSSFFTIFLVLSFPVYNFAVFIYIYMLLFLFLTVGW